MPEIVRSRPRLVGLIAAALAVAFAASAAAGCGGGQSARAETPGAGAAESPEPAPSDGDVTSTRRGQATWYGGRFHGRTTASGETFNKHELTAAHRELGFGTRVRVTNLDNDRSVVVRINDRGPFGNPRRIIDVSRRAAEKLGMIGDGVAPVKLEILADD